VTGLDGDVPPWLLLSAPAACESRDKPKPRDGAFPYAGPVADAAGNLYGTTETGGQFDAAEPRELPGVRWKSRRLGSTVDTSQQRAGRNIRPLRHHRAGVAPRARTKPKTHRATFGYRLKHRLMAVAIGVCMTLSDI
jgi:hypothetical protein